MTGHMEAKVVETLTRLRVDFGLIGEFAKSFGDRGYNKSSSLCHEFHSPCKVPLKVL